MMPRSVRIKRLKPVTGEVVSDRTDVISDTPYLISFKPEEDLFSVELVPDDADRHEEVAFDLAFDPSALCAVCVASLNSVNAAWQVKAIAPDGRYMDLRGVRTTARWAFELLARGGKIEIPGGNTLPLHAASVYRGTPLCEYDLTPAIMGQGPYKF